MRNKLSLLTPMILWTTAGLILADTTPTEGLVNYETPHVHPIDLTPDGQTLLVVNTAAHALEVFDVRGGSPVLAETISVGIDPVSVRARSNTEAWVVNHVSDSISIVNLATRAVVQTLLTGNEPADVVFAGTPARAFVSCSEANRIEVFNLANLSAAPTRIAIGGEDPRHLAVSPDGRTVYAAIFESGNGTTAISGGGSVTAQNVVSRPEGPYAGQNPPPNRGNTFSPPIRPGLPTPPRTAMIVRKDASSRWLDDNNRDWSIFVNGPLSSLTGRVSDWDLTDRDVAVIDAQTLALGHQSRLMTMVMALGVNPATGRVTAIGTEAINEVRFEPNLNGVFMKVQAATFSPGGVVDGDDLNPHLTYQVRTLPSSERQQSIGDPRGIAWRQNGQQAFITGMGSNNVIVIDAEGNRVGHFAVGEGPTGIVLDDTRGRGYVLNKFAGTVSMIDLNTRQQTGVTAFNDPTPAVIKEGRPFLYNTHLTSGLGQVSCASCHVDARTDRLAWDLGDPSGTMATVLRANNSNGNTDGTTSVHPMKGPMLTQTLQDIMKHDRLHWRGDRNGLASFNPAFMGLLGAERQLTGDEMAKFAAFLGTIHLPPNPYRRIDNTRPGTITLPDGSTVTTTNFNSLRGQNSRSNNCLQCHSNGDTRNDASNVELSQAFIAQSFPPFYDRLGFWPTSRTGSTAGFGFFHDGADSIGGAARITSAERQTAMLAEILTLEGPGGPLSGPERRQDTHAGVGQQVTVLGAVAQAQRTRIDQLIAIANGSPHAELIVKGRVLGLPRGYLLVSGTNFQADRQGETRTLAELLSFAAAGNPLTFTVVANGMGNRLAIDFNRNGIPDGDETAFTDDPANMLSNAGFESDLRDWDSGGAVTVSPSAQSGARAASLGASSFLVQSVTVTSGRNYRFSGWYFTQGSPVSIEAGVSFWNANGAGVGDRIRRLTPTGSYAEFDLEFTAPAGATSASFWILNGQGGGVTVDQLVFKSGGDGDAGGGGQVTDNLLDNGGFESGLAPWDRGNAVALSQSAKDGSQAARLGALSFIVQTKPAPAGENLTLSGAYFTQGGTDRREVGFSFWDAAGQWITDRTIVLGDAPGYRDFRVEATVPGNAASMTVWVWSGEGGGTITVDSLQLTRAGGGDSANLFTDGGFENGALSAWDTGGTVELTNAARTGSGAARLGADSFVVFNRSSQPREEYRFRGHYRTEGTGTAYEAGFSFWDAGGNWLGDSSTVLITASGYVAFDILGVVPEGAVSFSVWVWSGPGGSILVDDLELRKIQEAAVTEDLSMVSRRAGGVSELETGSGSATGGSEQGNTVGYTLGVDGYFAGLFHADTAEGDGEALTGGLTGLRLLGNGTFSGSGVVVGKKLSFKGRFDEGGSHAAVYRDGSRLDLSLVEVGGALDLNGTYTDAAGRVHRLRAARAGFSRAAPTDRAGTYTMLLPGVSESDPIGYATAGIAATGLVRVAGRLSDGRAFSHAGYLSARGDWTVHAIVARKPELSQLGGMLAFREDSPASDFDGVMEQTGVVGGAGTAGIYMNAIGSIFRPATKTHALDSLVATGGEAVCQLEDRVTGQSDYWPVRWSAANRIAGVSGTRRFSGSVNGRTGLFKATASDPATGLKVNLGGVVFQKQQLIGGTYRGKRESGAVIINAGTW